MKTFCVILFVGIIAQAYGNSHTCDPLAANISNVGRDGVDATNQELKLAEFLAKLEANWYVARATPRKMSGDEAGRFCTAPTHSKGCGPVYYYRKVTSGHTAATAKDLTGIKFETTFTGLNLETGKVTLYEMQIQTKDHNDYIFQAIPNTLKTYEIDENNKKVEVSVPKSVYDELNEEFALYRATADYAIYITCDKDSIWATFSKPAVDQQTQATHAKVLEEFIEELRESEALKEVTKPPVASVSTYMKQHVVNNLVPLAPAA